MKGATPSLAKHSIRCLIALGGAATLVVQAASLPPSSVIVWGGLSDASPWNGLSNVVAVDAGELHAVVLKSDGTVGCFGGCEGYITPTNNDAVAVSSGANYMLALRSNGTVVAWASPWNLSEGGDQVPLDLTNVLAIDAGIDLSVAGWANEHHFAVR